MGYAMATTTCWDLIQDLFGMRSRMALNALQYVLVLLWVTLGTCHIMMLILAFVEEIVRILMTGPAIMPRRIVGIPNNHRHVDRMAR
jgi:hypothetical protein